MNKFLMTMALTFAFVLPVAASNVARAADKHKLNACGCYGDGVTCTCERKAKCGCPGECEPKGCEESRQKEMQKEIDAETKRAKAQEQARNKPAEEGKGEAESDSAKAAAKPAVKPMTPATKKQFLKLLEAYLAEHPEAENKMLSEVRADLK